MSLQDLLKEASDTIREYAGSVHELPAPEAEKTASEPRFYVDMDELRSLADGK